MQEWLLWSAGGALIRLARGETSHGGRGLCAVPRNGILHHLTVGEKKTKTPPFILTAGPGPKHLNLGRLANADLKAAFFFFFLDTKCQTC